MLFASSLIKLEKYRAVPGIAAVAEKGAREKLGANRSAVAHEFVPPILTAIRPAAPKRRTSRYYRQQPLNLQLRESQDVVNSAAPCTARGAKLNTGRDLRDVRIAMWSWCTAFPRPMKPFRRPFPVVPWCRSGKGKTWRFTRHCAKSLNRLAFVILTRRWAFFRACAAGIFSRCNR